MTKKLLFIAMYRALDCLYDENPREDLGNYLSEANPYLFTDHNSADPAVFAGFSDYFDSHYNSDNVKIGEGYKFVRKYLSSKHLSYYGDFTQIFDGISLEEWSDLCKLICDEEKI